MREWLSASTNGSDTGEIEMKLKSDCAWVVVALFVLGALAWPQLKLRIDCTSGIKAACESIETEYKKGKPNA